MKICFFNRSYWPETGSTGQLLTELAEELVTHHGAQVSAVAGLALNEANGSTGAGWTPVATEWRRGVRILRARGLRLDKRRFAGRATNYLSYFASACLAGLRCGRPDVMVALTDPPIIGLAALLAARRSGARFVFLCQDIFPEVAALLEDFRNPAVDRLLDGVNRFLIRQADGIVALGETMQARLVAKGGDPARIRVIHNWADCTAITPGPKANPFSRQHGLSDKFVVMHSGNLGLSQGLEVLVDAAAELRHVPEIEVVFVGEGVKKPALQEQARRLGLPNVRFLPFEPKERLRESFASADVFVISLKTGLAGYIVPSKLYGTLAAGRPYVAAVEETSEVATITERYECGLVVPPGKPGALADRVLKLYYDRPLAERMGANARLAALEFDRPGQVRAYYDLFSEVIGRHEHSLRLH